VGRVDGWLRGREPDPVTRLQVDKVLSYYTRMRNRHLKLEEGGDDELPEIVPPPKRGIKEETGAFPGTRVFNVYANNVRLGRWESLPDVTDEQLLQAFEDLVERRAPAIKVLDSSSSVEQPSPV